MSRTVLFTAALGLTACGSGPSVHATHLTHSSGLSSDSALDEALGHITALLEDRVESQEQLDLILEQILSSFGSRSDLNAFWGAAFSDAEWYVGGLTTDNGLFPAVLGGAAAAVDNTEVFGVAVELSQGASGPNLFGGMDEFAPNIEIIAQESDDSPSTDEQKPFKGFQPRPNPQPGMPMEPTGDPDLDILLREGKIRVKGKRTTWDEIPYVRVDPSNPPIQNPSPAAVKAILEFLGTQPSVGGNYGDDGEPLPMGPADAQVLELIRLYASGSALTNWGPDGEPVQATDVVEAFYFLLYEAELDARLINPPREP